MDLDGKPLIDYPCEWEYRIIGSDEAGMRAAVAEIVDDRAHSLRAGNRKGKYLSLKLKTSVVDEADRDRIYQGLSARAAIRMVI